MPPKRPHSPSPPPQSSPSPSPPNIHISAPLTDRSSTFIGAFSPTAPLESLQSLPRFASATHRIAAWRIPSTTQRTISGSPKLDVGFDDDGERFGGKTLLKVLEEEKVRGVCVVARWFGGVMLGPVRFEHLRGCARGAVGVRRMKGGGDFGEAEAKRIKVGEAEWEMEIERDRLIRELPEWDESIKVLRGLLAGKKGGEEGKGKVAGEVRRSEEAMEEGKGEGGDRKRGESHEAMPATPSKMTPAYEKMPLEALRKLEKVRDATIGWILKQIEDAEQKGNPPNEEGKEAG